MLDNSNKLPLYYQLVNTLLEQIDNEMVPNDKLPTEKEICEAYSVSRTTVRLAMNELEKRGYIYRVQGKGSFVSSLKKEVVNSFFSLDFMSHYEGIDSTELHTQLLSFEKELAQLMLRQQMGLPEKQNILKIRLLHQVDETPVAIETLVLNNQYFSSLTADYVKTNGIDQAIEDKGIQLKVAEERYKVRKLKTEEQELLKTTEQVALVVTKSIYNSDNELIIMSERRILTDKFSYQNFLQTNN